MESPSVDGGGDRHAANLAANCQVDHCGGALNLVGFQVRIGFLEDKQQNCRLDNHQVPAYASIGKLESERLCQFQGVTICLPLTMRL
jgi:hypothetical protein